VSLRVSGALCQLLFSIARRFARLASVSAPLGSPWVSPARRPRFPRQQLVTLGPVRPVGQLLFSRRPRFFSRASPPLPTPSSSRRTSPSATTVDDLALSRPVSSTSFPPSPRFFQRPARLSFLRSRQRRRFPRERRKFLLPFSRLSPQQKNPRCSGNINKIKVRWELLVGRRSDFRSIRPNSLSLKRFDFL
jgi:hypothetical protein